MYVAIQFYPWIYLISFNSNPAIIIIMPKSKGKTISAKNKIESQHLHSKSTGTCTTYYKKNKTKQNKTKQNKNKKKLQFSWFRLSLCTCVYCTSTLSANNYWSRAWRLFRWYTMTSSDGCIPLFLPCQLKPYVSYKAPKTALPELTAGDLLTSIKENIHLIKYREIPWRLTDTVIEC